MNTLKTIENLRKRNSKLQDELTAYKKKENLFCSLESLKSNWERQLEFLKEKQSEYDILISELRQLKQELLDKNLY